MITRHNPRNNRPITRLVRPWLISRFIDKEPTFLFVPANQVKTVAERDGAIPYDIPGVELGHHGKECSFDAFLEKYKLDDPALRALAPLGFAGCNLTIPHKELALAIADHVDPLARRIGAINLVVVGADGSLTGRNTDGFGYIESIVEAAPDWRADAGPITRTFATLRPAAVASEPKSTTRLWPARTVTRRSNVTLLPSRIASALNW